ncbi:MAG: hypothetical protein Unbinned4162contig1001_76 [Prokaryotic dsDNA virus sp.]|nr:MAG: hypothetical protein Unbinned4162contig1001_76 [Prokaryotic dsDNA virus sp.]|tara:strand:+ start:34484 stop:34693 length:210 start_codon:yes stop_codon:yes gene_type:complete
MVTVQDQLSVVRSKLKALGKDSQFYVDIIDDYDEAMEPAEVVALHDLNDDAVAIGYDSAMQYLGFSLNT